MNDLPLAITGQVEIYVPVGSVWAPRFSDRPSLSPEHLSNKPFELRRVEATEVRGPLNKTSPIASLNPNREPAKAHYRGQNGAYDIRLDQAPSRPAERKRQDKATAYVQEERKYGHGRTRDPAHKSENGSFEENVWLGHCNRRLRDW